MTTYNDTIIAKLRFKRPAYYHGLHCEVSGCKRATKRRIWFPVPGEPVQRQRSLCESHALEAEALLTEARR